MTWGKRFLSVSIRALLLAACGIQGIAPDAKDMASLRGLHVLCQLPVPLEHCGYDSDEDEAAVCGTTSYELKTVLRKIVDRSSRFDACVSSLRRTPCAAAPSRFEKVLGSATVRRQLCLSLCRLVC
jgi:hypothetical protein